MAKIAPLTYGNHAPVLPVLAGAATDADFVGTPPNGTTVVANGLLSVRIAGAWETFTPDV